MKTKHTFITALASTILISLCYSEKSTAFELDFLEDEITFFGSYCGYIDPPGTSELFLVEIFVDSGGTPHFISIHDSNNNSLSIAGIGLPSVNPVPGSSNVFELDISFLNHPQTVQYDYIGNVYGSPLFCL